MKIILFALAMLITQSDLSAQKITVSEIDKFTGKKRVETNYAVLKMGLSYLFRAKLRSVDSIAFIIFHGSWMVGVVGPDDPTTFLFEDKSTFTVYPTSIQSYQIATSKYGSNTYNHQYSININDVEKLATQKVISIRRVANSKYGDLDLKEKNAKQLQDLAKIFLAEMRKG